MNQATPNQQVELRALEDVAHLNERHRAFLVDVASRIRSVEPNVLLILYGSRARGKAPRNSDWDILIVTQGRPALSIRRLIRRTVKQYDYDTSRQLQLVFFSRNRYESGEGVNSFLATVDRDGVVL